MTEFSHPLESRERAGTVSWLVSAPGMALLFLMLFAPLAYQVIKAPLLGLTLGIVAVGVLDRKILRIHPTILLWSTLMISVGLLYILLGLSRGAPGSVRLTTAYALWPLIFTFLLGGTCSPVVMNRLFKVLVFGALAISLYSLSYVLSILNLIPGWMYIEIDQGQAIGFHEGYVDINIHSTNSLIFLVPFLTGCILTWPSTRTMPVSRAFLWVAYAVSLAFGILSARRALWVIIAISPFVALFFRSFVNRSVPMLSRSRVVGIAVLGLAGLVVLFVALQQVFDIAFVDMFRKLTIAFDMTSKEGGGSLRGYQLAQLLDHWSNHPWFGSGLGSVVPNYVRSETYPWSYELFYVAIMNQTGVIGLLMYILAGAWIFGHSIRILMEGGRLSLYVVPALTGTLCYLVANASNPMIGKFDHVWIMFLPLIFVNYRLLNGPDGRKQSQLRRQVRTEGPGSVLAK